MSYFEFRIFNFKVSDNFRLGAGGVGLTVSRGPSCLVIIRGNRGRNVGKIIMHSSSSLTFYYI